MENTRLPAGGRTAANIHPRQAEKDLERNSRSDGHACAGGKHALSMPEEPFPSARIISIARIRGTTVKAARAELPNGRNRPGTGPRRTNRLAAWVHLGDRTLKLSDPHATFPHCQFFLLSHRSRAIHPRKAGMATVAGCHSNRSYDAVERFVGRRDGLVAVVSEPKRCRNQPQEGKQRARRPPYDTAKVALGWRQSTSGLPHRCGRNNCTI